MTRHVWGSPYLLLIGWTLLALLPMPWLLAAVTAPIPAGCSEYCGLGAGLATARIVVISEFWLLVALGLAWTWDERSRTIAAVSAVGASLTLVVVTAFIYRLVPPGRGTLYAMQFMWALSLGFQLPPVWRLAKRRPPTRLRFVVDAMGVAVFLAAMATAFLGNDPIRSPGPAVVFVAWIVFGAGLSAVAIRAWRQGTATFPMVAPLLAANLPLLLVPIAAVFPGEIGYVALLQIPLSAIGWLWIAIAWFRGEGAWVALDAPPPPSDVDLSLRSRGLDGGH